jgi:hypothetical protein
MWPTTYHCPILKAKVRRKRESEIRREAVVTSKSAVCGRSRSKHDIGTKLLGH